MYQIGDRVKAWVYSWGVRAAKEPGLPDINQEAYIVAEGMDEWRGHQIPIYYLSDLDGNIFKQENSHLAKTFYSPAILVVKQAVKSLEVDEQKKIINWCTEVWQGYEAGLWKKKSGCER